MDQEKSINTPSVGHEDEAPKPEAFLRLKESLRWKRVDAGSFELLDPTSENHLEVDYLGKWILDLVSEGGSKETIQAILARAGGIAVSTEELEKLPPLAEELGFLAIDSKSDQKHVESGLKRAFFPFYDTLYMLSSDQRETFKAKAKKLLKTVQSHWAFNFVLGVVILSLIPVPHIIEGKVRLLPKRSAYISFKQPTRILEYHVPDGAKVKAGQRLFDHFNGSVDAAFDGTLIYEPLRYQSVDIEPNRPLARLDDISTLELYALFDVSDLQKIGVGDDVEVRMELDPSTLHRTYVQSVSDAIKIEPNQKKRQSNPNSRVFATLLNIPQGFPRYSRLFGTCIVRKGWKFFGDVLLESMTAEKG